MTNYRVTWTIDVEASSPHEACRKVWTETFNRALPSQPDDACVFEVEWSPTNEFAHAESTIVDLGDEPVPVLETPTDEQYREAACRYHHREGELEIDDEAKVSRGDDPGAYVQAWVWVPVSETEPEPPSDD